jgi:rhodanese-related sulfurtransferase
LKNRGYDKVSALYGGLGAWRNLNYPLEKGAE